MDAALETALQEDNPWIRSPEVLPRWLQHRLPERVVVRDLALRQGGRWEKPGKAHLVIGPRQAGKSTMLWSHLAARTEPVLYLDCEQALVRDWCRSAPLFLAGLADLLRSRVPLFFDEVQHLDDAGLFLKGLVDRRIGVPLLVTGSSSYHLASRTRESLAGRATRSRLLPFSFREVCADLAGAEPVSGRRTRAERLARHVVVGGYPEVWLSDEPGPLLHDLVESFVLRDASDRFRIERPDVFRQLILLLARQVGSLVNLSEWASVLGAARETIAAYLALLEETHVASLLRPFAGGRRSELTSRPKVYLVDGGLRNQLVGDLRPLPGRADTGPLFEGWVFSELLKAMPDDASLHYWRSTSGAEVDFVVSAKDRPVGVEVKAGPLRRPGLPRGARSFIDAYKPSRFVVANATLDHAERLGETEVR